MSPFKKIMLGLVIFPFSLQISAQTDNQLLLAFQKSYKLEQEKNYIGSIEAVKAVATTPSYETNLRLGWLNYMAGLYKESMDYYQAAINLAPNSIEAKSGYIYPASALGNTDQVIAQYTKIIELAPGNTSALYQLGMIYYYKKNYIVANKYFEKIVNLYPFGYDALLMYAWTNFQLGKTGEAKILFNKVLLLSPYDTSALEGLGLIK